MSDRITPWDRYMIVKEFVERVERIAEANMLKTGRLEGAHYNAMKQLLDNMRPDLSLSNKQSELSTLTSSLP